VERLGDYPWSGYRALAFGRGGPAWFDRRLAYERFDLDGKRFREAVRRYDERQDDLLSCVYYGLVLGSQEMVEVVRRRLMDLPNREKPQLQAVRSHASLPDRLAEYSRKMGIDEEELAALLRPTRNRERPSRDALIYLLWREGHFRQGQIAAYFGVGYSAVSQACQRVERHLTSDRRFQSRLQAIMK
jgi:hypothetical protein